MKKLRIAQVTNLQESVPPLNKNGLEQVVSYLTEELVKMGHEVTLFATGDSKTSAKLVNLWPTAVSRDQFSTKLNPSFFTKIAVSESLNSSENFDIIHDHSRYIAPHFSKIAGCPIISTVHHPINYILEQGYLDSFPKEYLPYFNPWVRAKETVHTVLVSNSQKEIYTGSSSVIHNGIPLDSWDFSDTPGHYLAFLGYITPDKGAAEAVQAVLKTQEKLLIAGPVRNDDPAGQTYFKDKIEPFLGDQIQYIGPLNYDQKVKFLSDAKATLIPIQWDEPFGMVAIESLASGTPIIAWNRAAMPEIIEDGRSGYLVNSVQELTDKIGQVDKINRKNCRKRVEENFTARQMAENYVALYYQQLSK